MASASPSQGSLLLQKQLKDLCKKPVDGFSAGLVDECNLFEWSVTIIGPPDTLYDGGFFNAIMSFPQNYPNSPPTVKFTSEMWHPNVYSDGKVCISILHPPGDDPNGYELASERWSPVHTVESIMLSIISMLSSPNDESPANVEAAKEWRDNRDEFKKKVSRCAESKVAYSSSSSSDLICEITLHMLLLLRELIIRVVKICLVDKGLPVEGLSETVYLSSQGRSKVAYSSPSSPDPICEITLHMLLRELIIRVVKICLVDKGLLVEGLSETVYLSSQGRGKVVYSLVVTALLGSRL
ncbi:Ubiquitin-conjugating enzyme E2 7 [Capsicum annuum]|nr:Ubiquitin-conjugating enzyme E2 7 [Capsicum annuum]